MLKSKSNRIIIGCLLFIMATVGGAWLVFDNFATKNELKAQQNLSAIALAKKSQIETFLTERLHDAELLALRPAVWQSLATENGPLNGSDLAERLKLDIEQTANIFGYADVQLLDLSFRRITVFKGMPTQKQETTAFQNVLYTQAAAIVDMHLHDGHLCFGIASPVFAEGNKNKPLIGIVYLEVDVETQLYPLLAEWPLQTESAETLLVEKLGNEIIYLSQLRYAPDTVPMSLRHAIDDTELLDPDVDTAMDSSQLTDSDYRGVQVIAAAFPIKNTPWLIIAKIDQAEVNEPVGFLTKVILSGTTATMVMIIIASILLWRVRYAAQIAQEIRLDQRYTAARQASIDAYLVFDDALHILDVNDRMSELNGYSREELLRKRLDELNIGLDAEHLADKITELKKTGRMRLRTWIMHKSGAHLDIDVSASVMKNPAGNTFHVFVHDITAELAVQRRIERLNAFYVFLSHTNATIFKLSTSQEILVAVCEGAVRDGGFILSWAGLLDESLRRVQPVASFGSAAGYVQQLVITTDPALPTSHGPTRMCMVEQKIAYTNDFQNDSRTLPWHELGKQHDLNSSAAVPVIVDGKSIAALTFYSSIKNYFDAEFRALLEEVAHNVSLAFQALYAEEQRQRAVKARLASEELFQRAFDASPVPMIISSLSSRKTKYINKAHVRIFGYNIEDIPDEAAWFSQAYNMDMRQQLQDLWHNISLPDAINAGPGFVVESPEITLHCKDGSNRICIGKMSVIGDDIIVQWQDLTEIRRAENSIIASEQRFRGMIEQTLTGIYVNQFNRLAYVNPRFCEITGYSREELLGRDSIEFYNHDQASLQKVLDARTRLHDGLHSVALDLSLKRKDGVVITVGVYSSVGAWDGEPAIIVMALDITEQKRAEEKIATYVKQLEAAVEGTLYAVANMVEQRDPYTSGHERRVGIIAADIAREMGWAEEQCNLLRLIGLVHDIGKISVPAEILSRPSQLSPLEYEIIKTHAEKGYEILKDVVSPWPIAEIIREHHERMDGSGYPQGLKGEQILPEARILAVADVLESMASHRPYRPAKGIDAAIAEIETHRDIWFDPDVVDALLVLIREKGYKLPS